MLIRMIRTYHNGMWWDYGPGTLGDARRLRERTGLNVEWNGEDERTAIDREQVEARAEEDYEYGAYPAEGA